MRWRPRRPAAGHAAGVAPSYPPPSAGLRSRWWHPHLLDLQAIDSAIDRLDARKRALEGEGEARGGCAQAELAERELGELRLSIDTFDRDAAKLEHEIDSIARKAADEESRLYGGAVANVKELASIATRGRQPQEAEVRA